MDRAAAHSLCAGPPPLPPLPRPLLSSIVKSFLKSPASPPALACDTLQMRVVRRASGHLDTVREYALSHGTEQ